MKTPRILGKIELLLLSVVISWIFLEVAIKVLRPEIGWMQRPDPLLGWSSVEFQDFAPGDAREPGVGRILFLGDSFLAGSGVHDLHERFPCLVQEDLAPRCRTAVLASGGWGNDQELLAFMTKGAAWDPDLVVLAFCANNDISNNLSHHHGQDMLKPYFTLDEGDDLTLHDARGRPFASLASAVRGEDWPPDPLWKHSYVLGFLVGEYHGFMHARRPDADRFPGVDPRYRRFMIGLEWPEEIYACRDTLSWPPQLGVNHASAFIHEDFATNTYQWRLCERILVRLQQEVRAGGGRLAVMLLPAIFNPRDPDTIAGGPFVREFATPDGPFTFRSAEPRDRLAAICARHDIAFCDPTDDFRRRVREGDLLTEVWPDPEDRHFSALGHRILAGFTEDWLRREGAVSP